MSSQANRKYLGWESYPELGTATVHEAAGETGALPSFAPNVGIRGTAKDPAARGALGERIRIGEMGFETGDLIIGDADGVVAIPAAISEQSAGKGSGQGKKRKRCLCAN